MVNLLSTKNTIKQSILFLTIATIVGLIYALFSPQPREELIAAGLTFVLLLVSLVTPWERLRPNAPIFLYILTMVVLSITTYLLGGISAGNGQYYTLSLVWVALNFSRNILYGSIALAAVSYSIPIILTDKDYSDFSVVVTTIAISTVIAISLSIIRNHLLSTLERLEKAQQTADLTVRSLSDINGVLQTNVLPTLQSVSETSAPTNQEKLNNAIRIINILTNKT